MVSSRGFVSSDLPEKAATSSSNIPDKAVQDEVHQDEINAELLTSLVHESHEVTMSSIIVTTLLS